MFNVNYFRFREIGAGELDVRLSASRSYWSKQNFSANSSSDCGNDDRNQNSLDSAICARMPQLLREHEISLGHINKVFASAWLSSSQIIMGTKCNQIYVYNDKKKYLTHIPSLAGSHASRNAENCGIHAITKNLSGTLIATGGQNPSDVAVYSLPSLQPVTVGEGAHDDWIFDMTWLDDEFLVSGSRDSTIALYQFRENPKEDICCSHIAWVKHPCRYPTTKAITKTKKTQGVEKIRALSFNKKHKILTSISLNSHLYMLDLATFQQVLTKRLGSSYTECVCMCHNPEDSILVLGSRSQFTFFDARDYKVIAQQKLPVEQDNSFERAPFPMSTTSSVRSLSWSGPLVTVGTGCGEIRFYDVRNRKFLECDCGKGSVLQISGGWLRRDEQYQELFMGDRCPNAIYTHCYDSSGIRLFAAGGPITAAIQGNYAAIWS